MVKVLVLCVCVGMVKFTLLLKLKGLGLHMSRVYGSLCNVRCIEKKMHGKEYFLLNLDLMEICYY